MAKYKYVGWDKVTAYTTETGSKKAKYLLWGDRVEVLDESGSRTKIRSRSRYSEMYVDKDALDGEALLELYFIDVGQGDGVLIVTPDRKHILIDGGYPRRKQNTGKSAADFVDWKFFNDYKKNKIHLDAMICSHNDEDHYGGLADLLDVDQVDELNCKGISVDKFYHAGLSWWKTPTKSRTLGEVTQGHFTNLLTSRTSAINGLKRSANPKLQGEWSKFLKKVTKTKTRSNKNTPFKRLSHKQTIDDGVFGKHVSVKVLGPIETSTSNGKGLKKLGGNSQNTNGHSVLMRLDYGGARVLLTGDLNKKSMRYLLDEYDGEETEFLADVSKACHHGSDDVSFEFLAAIKPAVTVISSGDAEGHDHPRPSIIGASGSTGYLTVKDDEIVTPLVYSTELARSVSLGDPYSLKLPNSNSEITGSTFDKAKINYSETKPGALNPEKKSRTLGYSYIVAGQVYGLVNVRTDGKKILCATMNEGNGSWQTKVINARFQSGSA